MLACHYPHGEATLVISHAYHSRAEFLSGFFSRGCAQSHASIHTHTHTHPRTYTYTRRHAIIYAPSSAPQPTEINRRKVRRDGPCTRSSTIIKSRETSPVHPTYFCVVELHSVLSEALVFDVVTPPARPRRPTVHTWTHEPKLPQHAVKAPNTAQAVDRCRTRLVSIGGEQQPEAGEGGQPASRAAGSRCCTGRPLLSSAGVSD